MNQLSDLEKERLIKEFSEMFPSAPFLATESKIFAWFVSKIEEQKEAVAALCERKMNQWISVDDKLPESNGHWSKPILVYTIMDEMVVSEFIRPKNGEDLDSWLNLGSHEVTYWMPLPEPPKDLTEKKTTTKP